MWAQIRYVVGIDQRVCTNERKSMDMSSKYIYPIVCEYQFLFFSFCLFLPILQNCLLAYSDKAVGLIKSE